MEVGYQWAPVGHLDNVGRVHTIVVVSVVSFLDASQERG